jgi:penicillin-binding protein 1C
MIKKLTFFLLISFLGVWVSLPSKIDINKKTKPVIALYDRHGQHIRSIVDDDSSTYISLQDIPALFNELTINAEDKRFYYHNGIDFLALLRAMKQNLRGLETISGASTISQQLVRMAFSYKRSLFNKPLVMLHALKIETKHTKGEILEYYYNLLPYSYKVKGIQSASLYYFGKTLKGLSAAEMATLVVLIRAPSRYSQKHNKEKLLEMRNKLIDSSQLLSKSHKELSKKEKWYFENFRNLAKSPHFIRALLKKHKNNDFNKNEIKTTLDLKLQTEIQKYVTEHMKRLSKKGVGAASVLVLDNKTGDILTYIGNYDFFNEAGGEYDGILIPRQPGSTLKPFTYALALENQYHPASILPDVEMYFKSGLGTYKPRNYSLNFTGPRTLRESLGNSLNIPALYLADQLGVENLMNFYQSFGLTFKESADFYGVGLTLGNGELTLLDLTNSYMAFANKGQFTKARFLHDKKPKHIKTKMSPATAEMITDILSDRHARKEAFGNASALDTDFHSAAKTGTSTLYRDNWVVGFTENFTVGVWVGNMDQKEMENVSGITGAGPIYQDTMNIVAKNYRPGQFKKTQSYHTVKICAHSGSLPTKSCQRTYTESFLPDRSPTKRCSFHKKVIAKNCHSAGESKEIDVLSLPSRYQKWLWQNEIGDISNQVKKACMNEGVLVESYLFEKGPFKILSPVSGALYAIDPSIPKKWQELQFDIAYSKKVTKIKWFRNNELLKVSKPHQPFKWKLLKGVHNIKAKAYSKNGLFEEDNVLLHVY